MSNTDEILQRIQDRLDARANGVPPLKEFSPIGAAAHGTGGKDALSRHSVPASPGVLKLSPDQIVSTVYTVAPAQIEFIAETFANAVADGLNMRTFAPRIREIAMRELVGALCAAKKQGVGGKQKRVGD